jgi:hypothetical protein
VPFGGTRQQKSISSTMVDTGNDVCPSGPREKCRYRSTSGKEPSTVRCAHNRGYACPIYPSVAGGLRRSRVAGSGQRPAQYSRR